MVITKSGAGREKKSKYVHPNRGAVLENVPGMIGPCQGVSGECIRGRGGNYHCLGAAGQDRMGRIDSKKAGKYGCTKSP